MKQRDVRKSVLGVVLMSAVGTACAAGVFYPQQGEVCDRVSHFCADKQGISMGLTELHLGKSALDKLQQSMGDGVGVHLDSYTLSNGVYCESKTQTCYSDRFKTRKDATATEKLFGQPATDATSVFFPSSGVICDRKSSLCADASGISLGLTLSYLGQAAQDKLQQTLGDGTGVDMGTYTLSNGVYCDSQAKACYSDRFKTQLDFQTTKRLFH
ncbi:YcgJ family protein [Serratia marcescens]|uniref:YcgJ family protein n=1 Tax=Serratia marcescens TaxID=615 RepID=UPI002177848B|nr:YcgJ family protein [Serratia marcescens]CAI1965990.1 Fels-1 Prophage Protein-like [Serratia marcescens]